jgi:hypothetical protein
MEFHVNLAGSEPDLALIEQALLDADPSAVADVDASGTLLRVATSLDAVQLLGVVRRTGIPVDLDAVRQLPSICCGGCIG